MFFRPNEFIIEKSDPDIFIIAERKRYYYVQMIFTVVFMILWYGVLLLGNNFNHENRIIKYIFIFGPLLNIFRIVQPVKMLIAGNRYIFERGINTFYHNKDEKSRFSDIGSVVVRTAAGADKTKEYLLSLNMKDRNSIFILKSDNKALIREMGEKISAMIAKDLIIQNA